MKNLHSIIISAAVGVMSSYVSQQQGFLVSTAFAQNSPRVGYPFGVGLRRQFVAIAGSDKGYLLIVDKSDRKMYVFKDANYETEFPVSFSIGGLGDKNIRGDNKTPEGIFKLLEMRRGSYTTKRPWAMFKLNYPLVGDAQRGFEQGIIDERELKKIVEAHEHHKMPPQDTRLGGHIELHGPVPEDELITYYADYGYSKEYCESRDCENESILNNDFNAGCISLQKEALEYLINNVPLRSTLLVRQ